MFLPQTEMLADHGPRIDAMSVAAALEALLAGQIAAVSAVRAALPQIERAAARMAETITNGGTLVYVAAGSSGLMALADAAELPGTFGISQRQIRVCMAGGVPVDAVMPGDTEDDTAAAAAIAASLAPHDLVIALSASGTTPYPCAVAQLAAENAVGVVSIANNAGTPLLDLADIAICLPTPPEVLAGSTRLGAGSAQKVALNMLSTMAGVMLGHVHDGMMVNLAADNAKLRNRAGGIVATIAGVSADAATAAIRAAAGNTKLAILTAAGCSKSRARVLLQDHKGHLGACLQAFRSMT